MRTALAAALLALALPATAQDTDDRRPPLFAVEDTDSRVVLLGSVHVLPDGALPLPAHVEDAYNRASVVAFELDLDLGDAGAAHMARAATDEALLTEVLTSDQQATVHAALGALGLPAGALDPFEPWFGGMMYGVLALQQSGLPVAEGGVDAHFFGRAKADGKERVAFETVEVQTAAFDDLPTESQVAFLLSGVSMGTDRSAAMFKEMVDAWSRGKDARLASILAEGLSDPVLFDALLTRRNRAWVPQIEALLAREGEDALVVVGAGHLVGADSVVDLLRRAGYTVTRL